MTVIVLCCLMLAACTQPFKEIHVLNGSNHSNFQADISANSEVLVAGSEDPKMMSIYINEGPLYSHLEEWIELHQREGWYHFGLSLSALDMTADGQWIVAAGNKKQDGNVLSGVMAFYY